jgi:hypothetical protein
MGNILYNTEYNSIIILQINIIKNILKLLLKTTIVKNLEMYNEETL